MAIILSGRSYDFELVVANIATRHRKLVYVPPLKRAIMKPPTSNITTFAVSLMVVGADKDYSIMPNGVIKAEILILRQYFTMHPCWWSYNSELCKPWQLKKAQ